MTLSGESYQAFADMTRALLQDRKIAELCAVETLEREALRCVHGAASVRAATGLSQTKANALAADLRRRLMGPYWEREYLALVPGLALPGVLAIGAVELRPLKTVQDVDEVCRALAGERRKRVDLPELYQSRRVRQERALNEARAALTPPPRRVALATMRLALEHKKAFEVAEESVQDAVDLLAFFGRDALEASGELASEVWGQVPGFGDPPRWVEALRSEGCRIVFPRRSVSLRVTKRHLRRMLAEGFEWASAALAKRFRDRNPLERGVLLAIKWIAEAELDPSLASVLVKRVLALETLLLRGGDQPFASTLSERLAFLLGKTKEERMQVEGWAKRMYSVRSRLVHEGQDREIEDVMPSSWHLSTRAVIAVIRGAQRRGWRSVDDIAAWITEHKYG